MLRTLLSNGLTPVRYSTHLPLCSLMSTGPMCRVDERYIQIHISYVTLHTCCSNVSNMKADESAISVYAGALVGSLEETTVVNCCHTITRRHAFVAVAFPWLTAKMPMLVNSDHHADTTCIMTLSTGGTTCNRLYRSAMVVCVCVCACACVCVCV